MKFDKCHIGEKKSWHFSPIKILTTASSALSELTGEEEKPRRGPTRSRRVRRNFPGNYYDRVPGYRSLNCRVRGSRGDRSYLQACGLARVCYTHIEGGTESRHENGTRDSRRHVPFRNTVIIGKILKDDMLERFFYLKKLSCQMKSLFRSCIVKNELVSFRGQLYRAIL